MTKEEALKTYYGYDVFRGGQEAVIDALLSGRDALAIMPTGAGKSVCYQIPALLLSGITLVVSPLVSLMRDQVTQLVQMGIPAAFLNSSLTFRQYLLALDRARAGRYKIIYVAPERLETEGFQAFVREADISLVAVDEAHCISQWGQDFRPSYLNIPAFVESLPHRPPVGAFTAGGAKHSAASLLCRLHGPGHQCIADSLGEVPSQRCPVQRLPHLLSMVGQVHHRRLEAGEAHVQLCPVHMGVRQGVHPARGLPGQGVHGGAAGIGQAQHPGRLVEALPCCVIPGGAQNLHIRVVPDVHDHCVASGDGQGQEGRLQFRKGQVIGGDVAPDVVHRDQGHPQGKGHRLGEAEAHQHRADEPRPDVSSSTFSLKNVAIS